MANDNDDARDLMAVLVAMVFGALIGAITALLLAPKSGEELRSDIAETTARARERATDLKEHMSAKYKDLRAKVDEHLKQHTTDAVEATEELAEDVEAQLEEA